MQGMKDVKEPVFAHAPEARYGIKCVATEATTSKKSGASMLHLTWEINRANDESLIGIQIHDYIITDGNAKGAWMGKQKLSALGVPTDVDMPDEQIAAGLLGLSTEADLGVEEAQDAQGNKRFAYNEAGQKVQQFNNKIGQYVPVVAQAAPTAQAPVAAQPAPGGFKAPAYPAANGAAPQATPPWAAKPQAQPRK